MTRPEQVQFIEELIDGIKDGLIKDLHRVPAEWDGHELRQWICDRVERGANMGTLKGRRRHEYNNTVLTANL